jgi:maltose alpha-D-glucosyltransferase/alpha-amylase
MSQTPDVSQSESCRTPLQLPTCHVDHSWVEALGGHARTLFEASLPAFLLRQRWFGGKARQIQSAMVQDVIPLSDNIDHSSFRLGLIQVVYTDGEPESYLLPLMFIAKSVVQPVLTEQPAQALMSVESNVAAANGIICDASLSPDFWSLCHLAMAQQSSRHTDRGELFGWHNATYPRVLGNANVDLVPNILRAEQSNSAAILGDRFIVKLFRKVDAGVNPDLEISRFLTEEAGFPHSPALAGAIEYRPRGQEPVTVAIMHEFLGHAPQAWEAIQQELELYLGRVESDFTTFERVVELKPGMRWIDLIDVEPTPLARQTIGSFLDLAALLGQRTAEMHVALASVRENPAFSPEPYTAVDQQDLSHSMHHQGRRILQLLKMQLSQFSPWMQVAARSIVDREDKIIDRFRQIGERPITALRIRCHGDYHLGQVLFTGDDFAIIDYEGEPMRPLGQRRIKGSPLRDVAGMIRSFHYASQAGVMGRMPVPQAYSPRFEALSQWARFWYLWTSAVFVKAYLKNAEGTAFLPQSREEIRCLLDAYLLEKSLYELDYEMNNRPAWVEIPIRGVLDLISKPRQTDSAGVSDASTVTRAL